MLGNKKIQRTFTVLTGIAMICVSSLLTYAAPGDVKADITLSGQVTVNGQPAVSNSTVVTGSIITTGANSTAVIGVGSIGRVELMPETSVTLRYTDTSVIAMLASGKVRLSNAAGIGATVTTRSATVVADAGQANNFTVDIGCGDDVKCAQTLVQTTSGLVTLKSGSTTKQVSAGTDAVAGGSQTGCKPCFRPGSAPPVAVAGLSSGALAALLVGAGAAVVAAVIFGGDSDVGLGGPVTVVSPIQ